MSNETLPKIAQTSPYMVEVEAGKQYSWCACGLSKTQPFCDGAHKDTGMKSFKFTPTKNGVVALCGCKKTGNSPMCDGSHSSL